MNVTLNTWIGNEFLNDNICDICGKQSTTYDLAWPSLLENELKFCKICLLNMISTIDTEILNSKEDE